MIIAHSKTLKTQLTQKVYKKKVLYYGRSIQNLCKLF